jgi:hypothetical protein
MTRREIYHEILYLAMLNIRTAAQAGDAAQCYIESHHVHNLPSLLNEIGDDEKHAYYWDVERPDYIQGCKNLRYRAAFSSFWAEPRRPATASRIFAENYLRTEEVDQCSALITAINDCKSSNALDTLITVYRLMQTSTICSARHIQSRGRFRSCSAGALLGWTLALL